ncbi:MAG TPA: class I SAM-dependent methyltransferase [Pseudonocardiaceae bacterium]
MTHPPVAFGTEQVRDTYDAMAPWDRQFHDHPDVARWVALFDELIGTRRPGGKRLLDIGCGGGRSSAEFARLGYDVTAYDLSPGMIEQATARWGGSGPAFLVGDFRSPPDLGTFDVVVCFNEAFAHLHDAADLTRTLSLVADVLADDGVLVFDLTTLGRFRLHLQPPHVAEEPDFLMAGWSEPADFVPDMRLIYHLRWFRRDGEHWHRHAVDLGYHHFSVRTVRQAVADAGLTVLRVAGLHGSDLLDQVDENGPEKACYLVGRATRSGGAAGEIKEEV